MARVYGIDLGAHSVKLVVATPGFRHATITHVLQQAVPRGDDLFERRAAKAVGALVKAHGLETDTPYAALPGDQVFIHVLDFPFKNLRRAELAKAVGTELEGLLPVELEDMVFDFSALTRGIGEVVQPEGEGDPAFAQAAAGASKDGAPGGEKAAAAAAAAPGRGPLAPALEGMRVLACAARTERARELLAHLGDVDAEPRGLVAAPAAYARLAERFHAFETSKNPGPYTAIIDLGHARTDVCMIIEGRTNYARTIARGGHHLTVAIAQGWKLSYEDAERAKHRDGFIGSRKMPPPNPNWQHVHQVMYQELAPLARDLRRTLTACRAKTGAIISRAVLVGGGSRVRGIPEFLSEELNIECTLLSKDDNARLLGPELGENNRADIFCLAAGVAFEGASGRPSFDLRQGSLAYKADLSFLRAKAWSLVAAVIAILFFGGVSAMMENYKLKKAEKALDARLADESRAAFNEELDADTVLTRISPSEGSQSPIPKMTAYDILLALNAAMPAKKDAKLDIEELDIKPGKVNLRKGTSTPLMEGKSALDGVKLLEDNLSKSPCFKTFSDPDKKNNNDQEKTMQFSTTIEVGC